jgi:hypothetical protein
VLTISEDGRQPLFKSDGADLITHVKQQFGLKDNDDDINLFVRHRSQRFGNIVRLLSVKTNESIASLWNVRAASV